ncbi:MAG: ATP-binding cassette domain-containing protein [Candidatus Altiarchaeales archaeon]|nr:ATP-binding cassette domain-containing protein [Candidatus Altiarchaeales archaeon]MBD3417161.1 ATP-binding cassette domain-containing protein [Candidatus Altiarchaeales archaeon]
MCIMSAFVVAEGLGKTYLEEPAVDDVNFTVGKGEIFGFLGPNGAGKTTTLRMVCGVLDPSRGSCTVNGLDTVDDKIGVKEITGYLPEEDFLYGDMTVRDHLRYIGELYGIESVGEAVVRSLRAVDMEPQIDDVVKTLSKGQRRRVAIAKTLIHDPQIILLDEVTSGLDPVYARKMVDVIRELHGRGKTIILSTHLLDEATELCDRILIINRGRVMACDTLKAILEETDTQNLQGAFFKLIGKSSD